MTPYVKWGSVAATSHLSPVFGANFPPPIILRVHLPLPTNATSHFPPIPPPTSRQSHLPLPANPTSHLFLRSTSYLFLVPTSHFLPHHLFNDTYCDKELDTTYTVKPITYDDAVRGESVCTETTRYYSPHDADVGDVEQQHQHRLVPLHVPVGDRLPTVSQRYGTLVIHHCIATNRRHL